jgi:Pathogenicity locus
MSENELRTLPNVGPAIARKLLRLGVERPGDLRGQDPDQLFSRLCDLDGRRHDPCLLDTFVAAVDYANGAPARPWWYYSRDRKARAAGTQATPEADSPRQI